MKLGASLSSFEVGSLLLSFRDAFVCLALRARNSARLVQVNNRSRGELSLTLERRDCFGHHRYFGAG
jgi:hypothetical protein